jgi:hypothetical protein
MRYRTPEAFRAALDQRLKNEAATAGVALMRLRKRVAFERFLARLSAAESEGWMLTGAFALDLRLGLGTRTTKDIDLARADDEEAATEHLWARPYAELAGAVGISSDLDEGHAAAAVLLDPILGSRSAGRWDPRPSSGPDVVCWPCSLGLQTRSRVLNKPNSLRADAKQKGPVCGHFAEWREPDSNRRHHDFQRGEEGPAEGELRL